jgi:putative ABC transport system ATP-binding protein
MMLTLENLSYSYPDSTLILDNINLHILAGDRVMIMGPSGCGKTTLLRLMSGLLVMQEGSLKLNIRELHQKSFVFQDHQLVDYLTVLENILLPTWCVDGKFPIHLKEAADQLLYDFGLADKGKAYPCQLSGGQQQRVGIIRALLAKPEIIFADEPTGHLDEEMTRITINLLAHYCKSNLCTLVLVSHDPSLIPYVDTVYILKNKKLIKKDVV